MKTLGQIAYEAYEKKLKERLRELREADPSLLEPMPAPAWEGLASWLQDSWEEAASAAIHQYNIEENDE